MAVSTLTALSGFLGGVGCTHARTVNVPPSEVPALVERYAASSRIVIDDKGTNVVVTPRWSPHLELSHSCRFVRLFDCSPTLRAPLERVQFNNGTLHFPDVVLKDDFDIPPKDIDRAAVLLVGYDPGWRPTWGVGGSAGGAAGSFAATLHWLPQEWLALEVGVLPMLPAILGGFAAVRLRPLALGPIRPFTGWFVNGTAISHGNTATARTEYYDGVGPRLGFDFEIRRAHVIVTIEGDLVHPFDQGAEYFGQGGRWVPWGGGGVAYFF
jgi:hypothetical protein